MRKEHNSARKFLLPVLLALAFAPHADAEAVSAKCFMHGVITAKGAKKSQLSDMIRLHFDADEQKKCELLMTAYCEVHVIGKDYPSDRLRGAFRPESKGDEAAPETRYKFETKCKLVVDESKEDEEKK